MRATGMYLRNTCYMSATMECNMTDSTTSSHALKYPNLACLWRHFDIEKMLKQKVEFHVFLSIFEQVNARILIKIYFFVLYWLYWIGLIHLRIVLDGMLTLKL